jgi:hypothetical protein
VIRSHNPWQGPTPCVIRAEIFVMGSINGFERFALDVIEECLRTGPREAASKSVFGNAGKSFSQ